MYIYTYIYIYTVDGQQPRNFSIDGICVNGVTCSRGPFSPANYETCCSNLSVESFVTNQDNDNNVVANCYTCSGKNIQPLCSNGT